MFDRINSSGGIENTGFGATSGAGSAASVAPKRIEATVNETRGESILSSTFKKVAAVVLLGTGNALLANHA
jgi:hypothetical protein